MGSFGVFVTGTDTGVGKTEITAGLLRAFARQGLGAVGMKPVAAGCRRVGRALRNADVEALQAAATVRVPVRLVNPYAFEPPIAPHIAAARAGVVIEPSIILDAYRALAQRAEVVVVEGVGGFAVPFGAGFDAADLARRLRLPVVLVVGMRLGCINHALLTAEAIRARGLKLAGWVANRVAPSMLAYSENIRALQSGLDAPLLGCVAHHVRGPARRAAIDRALEAVPALLRARSRNVRSHRVHARR